MFTDSQNRVRAVQQAERKAAQGGAPVYMYLYNWATPVEGGKWRVPHSAEIGMVFDNVAKSESMSGPPGPEPQQIADILSETWIAFAKTGDPNNPKVPKWEPYEATKRETMVLDLKPELVSDPHGEERRLFEGHAPGRLLPFGTRGHRRQDSMVLAYSLKLYAFGRVRCRNPSADSEDPLPLSFTRSKSTPTALSALVI